MMKKRMTQKEKKVRASIRKELQEKGVLPPDKKPLNRKRFVEEARQEWNARDGSCLVWDVYIMSAISLVLGARDRNFRVSPEAVGAAKVLKLALRMKEFQDRLKAEGRTTYKIDEEFEFIRDILEA